MSGEAGEGRIPGGLRSAWRLRFASLPTRIVVAVFSAALVTGIAVTAISIGSTQRFLRAKIDERFPELLRSTARDLDQWYAQREVDIATFASSDTLASGLRPGAREGAASEARRYLAYVQRGFPQYRRLFVLDPRAADPHVGRVRSRAAGSAAPGARRRRRGARERAWSARWTTACS